MTISARARNEERIKVNLYISDEAYEALVYEARLSGYIGSGETAKGLSHYIDFLMTCHMEDARPKEVKEIDQMMRDAGMKPEWSMYTPRRRRGLTVSYETTVQACVHSIALGMPVDHLWSQKTLGDLLEAIGTEWVKVEVRDETT